MRADQPEDDETFVETPALRRLRLLVMALMVVLIAGMIAIAVTIVVRLGMVSSPPLPAIEAERFTLPGDARIVSIGRDGANVLFVLETPDGREALHLFDAETGRAGAVIPIRRD